MSDSRKYIIDHKLLVQTRSVIACLVKHTDNNVVNSKPLLPHDVDKLYVDLTGIQIFGAFPKPPK